MSNPIRLHQVDSLFALSNYASVIGESVIVKNNGIFTLKKGKYIVDEVNIVKANEMGADYFYERLLFQDGFKIIEFYKVTAQPSCSYPIMFLGDKPIDGRYFSMGYYYLFGKDFHIRDNQKIDSLFENYKNFLWSIQEENGINLKDLQFGSFDEFSSYLNNNLANDGDTFLNRFTIKLYAKQVNSYDKITKLGARNLFFASLKGGGNYFSRLSNLHSCQGNSELIDKLTNSIFSYFKISSVIDIKEKKRTIWLPQSKDSLYALPARNNDCKNHRIMMGDKEKPYYARKVYDYNLATPAIVFRFEATNDPNFSCELASRPALFGLTNKNNFETLDFFDQRVWTDPQYLSFVMVWKVKAGEGQTAFYLKPIGVDSFNLKYVKGGKIAKLQMITYKHNHFSKIVDITNDLDVDPIHSQYRNCSWRIRKNAFLKHLVSEGNVRTFAYKSVFRDFKFFYSFADGTISDFSAEVFLTAQTRGAGLKIMFKENY